MGLLSFVGQPDVRQVPRVGVVHCKVDPYDVYVGRGPDPMTGVAPAFSWGNPYRVAGRVQRGDAILLHEAHVLTRPWMVALARTQLKDRVVACWCKPAPCHGDTLVRIANSVKAEHVPEVHQSGECPREGQCNLCDGGLFVCRVCGSAEGASTTECPGTRMTSDQLGRVYAGKLNYLCGTWVDAVYDYEGNVNMPCNAEWSPWL